MAEILVIEDDPKTLQLIRLYLEDAGHNVVTAQDGARGLALAVDQPPDLLLLDLMLPGMDGLRICQKLREEQNTPVIMLTARATEDDKLTGLDIGADDYITKPFSPREMVARVRSVLRRTKPAIEEGAQRIQAGGMLIDFDLHQVSVDGEPVQLTPREFRLLAVLARNPGRPYHRLDLLERAVGPQADALERTVDVHIMNLRRKIEADPVAPRYILTVYGVGYKFTEEFTNG